MNLQLFLYVFVASLLSLGFNFINRRELRTNSDATVYAWWFEFIRVLIFLPFVLLNEKLIFGFHEMLIIVLIGFSELFSVYFFMKMHANSELSASTIISQMRLVWVPVLAAVFLSERLAVSEYFGVGLIFVGQVIALMRKKMKFDSSVKYAFTSSIFVATNSIVGKAGTSYLSLYVMIVAMGLPTIFLFPLIMKNAYKRIRKYSLSSLKMLFLGAILSSLSSFFLFTALTIGNVSMVVGIFQAMSILGIAVGVLFLGEKEHLTEKILGGVVVLVGMLFLVW